VRASSETRAFLTEVSNWVDRELSGDAHLKGESGDEIARHLIAVLPGGRIIADFEVSESDRVVHVQRLKFEHKS
jgi:hypothetical protein